MLNRRGFLGGLVAALAAPTIIRTPGLLMPVKRAVLPAQIIGDQYFGASGGFGAPSGFNGLTSDMYAELVWITRRAMIPRLQVQMYYGNPTLLAFLDAKPAGRRAA